MFFQTVDLSEMVMCLEDLINYFAQPEDDMGETYSTIELNFTLKYFIYFRARRETKSVPCIT